MGGWGGGLEKLRNKVRILEKLRNKDAFWGFGSPQAEIFEDLGGVLRRKHVPECTPATRFLCKTSPPQIPKKFPPAAGYLLQITFSAMIEA